MDSVSLSSLLVQIPFLLACGALAGFLAGLLGIGGGVVLVPCLFYGFVWLGFDPAVMMHVAVGTSFAVIVPTGLTSARAHWKKDAVRLDLVRRLGAGILAGVLIGTVIAGNVTGHTLQAIFAGAIFLLALVMMVGSGRYALARDIPSPLWTTLAGTGIGTLSSLMGIGGATISVPFMTLCRVPIHKAIGTASALGLVISIPALAGYMIIGWDKTGLPPLSLGYISLPAAAIIVPATVMFAPLGVKFAHSVSVTRLRVVFACFMMFVAVNMIYEVLSHG